MTRHELTPLVARACLAACLVVVSACGESNTAPEGDTSGDTAADTVIDTADSTADTIDASPDSSNDTRDGADIPTPQCLDDRDCVLSCARGRCDLGVCRFEGADLLGTGCAIGSPPTCLEPGASHPAAPSCFFCSPSAAIGAFSAQAFAEDFETGAGRLTVEKLSPSAASWTISTRRAAFGARSLYFGDPATVTYDVGDRAAAIASTPPLMVPDGIELTLDFWLFADTESTPGFDFMRVLVVPADPGSPPREVWSTESIEGTTRGVFIPISVPLGSVQRGDRIAFEADSVDEVINRFEGFYIDRVRIASTCCSPEMPCDDGDPCTLDTCLEGRCTSSPIPGCCSSDVGCDDGDSCTQETCTGDAATGGLCLTTPVEGCCANARDCDDANPCTEDRCAGDGERGQCVNAPLCCASDLGCDDGDPCTAGACVSGQCRYTNSCCESDLGCDDGLACTRDTCVAGACRHEFTYAPGCCIPDVFTERFDLAALTGWSLSPPTNNVGWRLQSSLEARSAPSILYYGHPTLNVYESGGRNTGTATTPPVRLPDGLELTLSFAVRLDVEANPARDLFRVELLLANGQTVVPLVSKQDLTRNAWQDVSVDLSWASGQVVQLRLAFDTIDGTANNTRGVLVDDLRLLSSCLTRPCGANEDCGSRVDCITGLCDAGACRFAASCP